MLFFSCEPHDGPRIMSSENTFYSNPEDETGSNSRLAFHFMKTTFLYGFSLGLFLRIYHWKHFYFFPGGLIKWKLPSFRRGALRISGWECRQLEQRANCFARAFAGLSPRQRPAPKVRSTRSFDGETRAMGGAESADTASSARS